MHSDGIDLTAAPKTEREVGKSLLDYIRIFFQN
jgi:hypothetical protein